MENFIQNFHFVFRNPSLNKTKKYMCISGNGGHPSLREIFQLQNLWWIWGYFPYPFTENICKTVLDTFPHIRGHLRGEREVKGLHRSQSLFYFRIPTVKLARLWYPVTECWIFWQTFFSIYFPRFPSSTQWCNGLGPPGPDHVLSTTDGIWFQPHIIWKWALS